MLVLEAKLKGKTEQYSLIDEAILLVGSRDLNFYQIEQIKRIRLVRRADGYYAQFCAFAGKQAT